MTRRQTPPQEIILVYRPVGKSHVFTSASPDMSGFHMSHPSLQCAFELASFGLGKHVSEMYGCEAAYKVEGNFEDFEAHLKGHSPRSNLIKATLNTKALEAA
jgi:hypothetical protein